MRRGPAFQAAQGLFSPSADKNVRRALSRFVRRGPAFQAPTSACAAKVGAPRRGERTRHAAAPSTDVWHARVASCDMGQLFKPPKVFSVRVTIKAIAAMDGVHHRSKRARHAARHHHFGDRGVASYDVGQLFKPPKGSPGQARIMACVAMDGVPRRSELAIVIIIFILAKVVSLRATWANFSSRPRTLQPVRRLTRLRRWAGPLATVSVQDMLPNTRLASAVSLRAALVIFSRQTKDL